MKKSIFVYILLNAIPTAFACSVFATFAGANNKLVMAKNRDNVPDHQIIEVVSAKGKLKYLALSRADVPDFVSAGINERNLAVFNEVTIEYSSEAKGGIADDFSKDILQKYATVDEVIPHIQELVDKFPDPVFYQVTDGVQILSIEVAPKRKYQYTLTQQGVYAHTNNYQIKKLIQNYPYTEAEKARVLGSNIRLSRANTLLVKEHDVTLSDMQRYALDHSNGEHSSLYRMGEANSKSVRSLAFFGVALAKDGIAPAQVQIRLYNQGEEFYSVLDKDFWSKYSVAYTTIKASSKEVK